MRHITRYYSSFCSVRCREDHKCATKLRKVAARKNTSDLPQRKSNRRLLSVFPPPRRPERVSSLQSEVFNTHDKFALAGRPSNGGRLL